MNQPTQDTEITSSISPLFHFQDDDFGEKLSAGNNVKKIVQERPPTSFIMETVHLSKRESELDPTAKNEGSGLIKYLGQSFPWFVKFAKVIQSAVGSKNPKLLDQLLLVYIENMSRDVNTCYTKPYRAAKLKVHISETMMFFHLYWKNIKERVDGHNQYLDKMSEILGMYVDMELKASRRGKDSASNIAAKLLTAMFIYLDNSEEHVFRILFRVKFITKNYNEICSSIFTKVFAGVSDSMKCVTDVTYVRYLLALKLWKKIKDDLHEKKKINELAVTILGQRTPMMNPELAKIIPRPPECHKNGTLWLLQPNSFDLRKACNGFIKYELNEQIISLPDSIERLKIIDSIEVPSTQPSLESINRSQQQAILDADKSVAKGPQVRKMVKLRRFKPSFPKLKPGEVVFIDLTAENEENNQEDGKKKKTKDKKKFKWLKEVTKRSKLKKEREISDKLWIETADAHSTKDTKEGINTTINNWPISDNKITESTEQIQSTSQDIHRFGKWMTKLNTDMSRAEEEKKKCDTTCGGCKFCSSMRNLKYTATDSQGEIENSENHVTSQTSLLNNDAMVLINSFSEKDYVNCSRQESKDSGAHGSPIISESQSSYYPMCQMEHNVAIRMIKEESHDIIDDSTTDKNCDKTILTDSSSFNITKESSNEHFKTRNVSSHGGKQKGRNTSTDRATIPSTSTNNHTIHASATRGKHSEVKECMNKPCIVSTTASIVDFNAKEQINVISGLTNETLESNMCIINSNSDKNPGFWKKEAATNSFPTSNQYKSVEMSKTVSNKLQHGLIQIPSLDDIMHIGKDDIGSQSEDDEEKGCSSETMHRGSSQYSHKKCIPERNDDDFFQIPDIQLCDDLTNDNEVESFVIAGGKSKVDEFENIDILDSILNGDMSMQDILEEQQLLSMNSVSNDTSTNMLGLFTDYFKQSEVMLPNKNDCATDGSFHSDEVSKSLSEGSLGITGILNSLLDSDLTSIDSPSSDFTYRNVQTVDPQLFKKAPTAERTAFLTNFSTVSDLFSQKEQSSHENFTDIDSVSRKTKDQLFLDEKNSLNCTDMEEFGLNSSKETAFEMPVLEEELIQISQDPLINETMITHISPSSCESLLQTESEIVHLNEVKSSDFNNIQLSENNYDYSKLVNFKEFTSLRLNDIIQHSVNEIDHKEDLLTSILTDFTPPQSVDPPQSPYTFSSSPAPAQTVPHSPTHSIGISRHTIAGNMLTPPPSVPQLIHQNNLTPPPTPQQNQNYNEAVSQQHSQMAGSAYANLPKSRIHYLPINSQSPLEDFSRQQESFSILQKNEECKTARQKAGANITYVARTRKKTKGKIMAADNEDDCIVDVDQQQAAHLGHVQVALTRLTREEINLRTSGEQSILKSLILINRETGISLNSEKSTVVKTAQHPLQTPQLQRIDFREFSIAAQQNQPILINLNGKTKPALVFERNSQSDKLVKSLNEDVNSRGNIVYKLTSNIKPPATSKDKPYSKLPKVNFATQKSAQDLVSKRKSTITRCGNNAEISKETQMIIRPRCSTRLVKTQVKKSTKALNAGKNINIPITEEPSLKKRKITSKFLPLLENEGIIYADNQQKVQEKHSNVIRRDFTRKDRTKKKVV